MWDFSPSCPRSFLPYFILLFNYYSCVCFFLFLHSRRFHARDILCGIHTPCTGSPLPASYTRWSLVFRGEIILMAEALLPIDRLGRSQNNKKMFKNKSSSIILTIIYLALSSPSVQPVGNGDPVHGVCIQYRIPRAWKRQV